jgi:hypothetical protein
MIHALSNAFGNTYIASSPRRWVSSIKSDSPIRTPPTQNENLDVKKSTMNCGRSDASLVSSVRRVDVRSAVSWRQM